ncbi:DUF2752 domain-containing protein [Yinghuangia seranimata]|nr:DUF2752 domain-containing protein [Yinghuangia seranimata]MDI2126240.1 DUF2752 domain-containing protein [Yinghuangia seranimata]
MSRRLIAPVGSLLLAGAATVYIGTVDPNRPGHYPTCPFLWLTGRFCPGCGGLRCVNALAHGDLPAAVGFNVLAVALAPLVITIWLRWAVRSARGTVRRTAADPRLLRALLVVIGVFWVVRNLPFGAALAP